MGRGRKSRFIRPQEEVKQWFLDHCVDENGNKVSFRKLWWSDEFIEYSGMTGERDGKKSSNGTMSYWLKKWGLSEEYILNYHKNITFKVKYDVQLVDWSKKKNKNTNQTDSRFSIKLYDITKAKKVLNRILKEIGNTFTCTEYTKVEDMYELLTFDKLFAYDEKKLQRMFKKYYKELR